jgi:hypothetical protein
VPIISPAQTVAAPATRPQPFKIFRKTGDLIGVSPCIHDALALRPNRVRPLCYVVFFGLALVGLSACGDSVVGGHCKEGLSPCAGKCVAGPCRGLDGGLDGVTLDATELDGTTGELDAEAIDASLIDEGAPDDDGDDGSTGPTIDADGNEVGSYDSTVADTYRAPPDNRINDALVDTKKLDAAPDSSRDTQDAGSDARVILRDVGGSDGPDARSDASDTPLGSGDGVALDVSRDTSPDTRDVGSDARDSSPDLPGPDYPPDSPPDLPDVPILSDAGLDGGGKLDVGDIIDTAPRCPSGQSLCVDTCVDLTSDYQNCGLCGVTCGDSMVCVNSLCDTCPTGTACAGKCLDTQSDPNNCGACGVVCPGGACRWGNCKATTAGQIIVIGHDYLTNGTDLSKLLGNAVFLATSNQVQLAHYYNSANAIAVGHAVTTINAEGTARGRQVTRAAVSTSNILAQLTTADVFLISGQQLATDSTLQQLGTNWASMLSVFVHTGGIIVLLDANYTGNAGGIQILSQAGLVNISRSTSASGGQCVVSSNSDPLAANVSASYVCLANSTTFAGSDGTTVISSSASPVVIRKSF